MKRLPQSSNIYEAIEPVRVSLDDLEDIVGQLNNAGLEVLIRSDNIQYDSLQELREHRGLSVRSLDIEARIREHGYRKLELEFDGARVRVSSASVDEIGSVVFRVRDQVRSLKRRLLLLSPGSWWLLGAALTILSYPAARVDKRMDAWFTFTSLACYVMAAVAFVVRRKMCGLSLRRNHEGGFWSRNRDSVAMATISALLGALITESLHRAFEGK